MIMDYRLEFADSVSIAHAVGTTVHGNVIDMGVANKDYGDGEPIYLHVRMNAAAAASAGSSSIAFNLQEAGSTTPASFATKLVLKAASAFANYTAGYRVYQAALPSTSYKRYLRIVSAVTLTPTTGGTVDAWISLDPK